MRSYPVAKKSSPLGHCSIFISRWAAPTRAFGGRSVDHQGLFGLAA